MDEKYNERLVAMDIAPPSRLRYLLHVTSLSASQ